MVDERCSNCRFWLPNGEQNRRPVGNCRRYPPANFIDDTRGWNFPAIFEDGWCGEFAPKKERMQ